MKRKMIVVQSMVEFFGQYLPETKGLSSNTSQSYKTAFKLLFDYIEQVKRVHPENVSFSLMKECVEDYLQWLEDQRHCSRRTRNQRLAAISSYAKFVLKENFDVAGEFASYVLGIPQKRIPPRDVDDIVYFLPDELRIILRLPNCETISGRRDVVLMSVLCGSGARAQELCDLTVGDVILGEKTQLRLVGKGGKARRITLPKDCATLLQTHMKNANLCDLPFEERTRRIFVSQRSEHMTISCIETIVAKYVRQAKELYPDKFRCKNYTPHSFRHTIAVDMLESGCSLPAIKAFLGHASITSTLIYATVTSEKANRILRERGSIVVSPDSVSEKKVKEDPLWFLR